MEILDKLLLDLNESVECAEHDPVPIVANISGVSLKNYAATAEVLVASRLFSTNLHEVSLISYFRRTAFSDEKEVVKSRIDLCKFIALYLKKLKLQLDFGSRGNSLGPTAVGLFVSYGLHIFQLMIDVVKKENANELRSAALIPVKNILRMYNTIDKDRLVDVFTCDMINLDEVYTLLLHILQYGKSKISKGLKSVILSSLGHLVHCFSTASATADNIITIVRESVYLLKNSFDEKKPEFSIAASALSCVDRCLSYFNTEVFEQIKSNDLWELALKCVSSAQQEDVYRYSLAAKALRLVSHHTPLMRKEIARYSQVSYDILVQCYKCEKTKIDKHSEDALTAFLNELVACIIMTDMTHAPTQSDVLDSDVVATIDKLCALYLTSLSSHSSSTREFSLAITGLTAISPCISLMEEEYKVVLEQYQFRTATLLQALVYAAKYNVRFSTTVVSINTEMTDGRYPAFAMNTFRNKILLFQTICAVLNASETPDLITDDVKEYLKRESEEILVGYPHLENNIGVTRFVPVVIRSLVLLLNGLSRRSSLLLLDYLDSLVPVLFRQTLNRDLDAWERYTLGLYAADENSTEEGSNEETGDTVVDKVQLDENILLNAQVDTYLPLWYELLFPKDKYTRLQLAVYGGNYTYHDNVSTKYYDRLMSHVLEVLEKLTLSYKAEISADSETAELSASNYNYMTITPANLFDQDILSNIADFMEKLVHLTTSKGTVGAVKVRLASWYKLLVPSLVDKSKKYPLIAPLYHIVRVIFSIPFNNAMDSSVVAADMVLLVQSYILELQQALVDHSGEILYGILYMILSMPSYIMPTAAIMPSIVYSLESGVALYQSVLNLHKYLESDEDRTVLMGKIDIILPLLERQLKVELGASRISASTGNVEAIKNSKDYRSQFKRGKPHDKSSLIQRHTDRNNSVERQILRFIGRLGSFNQAIVAAKLTGFDSKSINGTVMSDESLFLRLSFQSDSVRLPLSKIYHRVLEICKSSGFNGDGDINSIKEEYQTKLVASELLHTITLIVIGNAATSPNRNKSDYCEFYRSLFPVLILQSVGTNASCVEIIEPLLLQIIRWFAGPNKVHDDEINELLDSLIDGLCATYVNDKLRDQCAKGLDIFFTYSMKREVSVDADLSFSQFASAVIGKLQTLLKQNVERSRVGAAMVLSKICPRFHKLERKMFTLLYTLLQSLHLGHGSVVTELPHSSYQIITKAINKFTVAISNAIVDAYNNSIDITALLGCGNEFETTSNDDFPCSLLQLIAWMWSNILCNNKQFRRSCMNSYSVLAPILNRVICAKSDVRIGIDSADIAEFMKAQRFDVQLLSSAAREMTRIQSTFMGASSSLYSRTYNVEEIIRNNAGITQEFANIIDSVTWVIKCRYMDCTLFYPDSKKRKCPDEGLWDITMSVNDNTEPLNIGPTLFETCNAFTSFMELVINRHLASRFQENRSMIGEYSDTLRRVLFLIEVILDACSNDEQRVFVGTQLRKLLVWSVRLHSLILDCVLLQVPDTTEADAAVLKECPFVTVLGQLVPYTVFLDADQTSLITSLRKRLRDIISKCERLNDGNPFIGGESSTLAIDSLEYNEIVFFIQSKQLLERLVDYYDVVFDQNLCSGMAVAAMKLLRIVSHFPLEATPIQVDYSSCLVQFALVAGAPVIPLTTPISQYSPPVMISCLHCMLVPGEKGELFYKRYGLLLVKKLIATSSIEMVHAQLSVIANYMSNPVIVEFTAGLLDGLGTLYTDKATLSKVICGVCTVSNGVAAAPFIRFDLPNVILIKLLEIHKAIGSYRDHSVLYELLHSIIIKKFGMQSCTCDELEIYIQYLPYLLYPDCHPDIAIPHKLYHDSVLYQSIGEFMANRFPLDSKGIDLWSDLGKEYTKLFYCMMDAMVASKSIILLKLFFTSLSEGHSHVFMKKNYICDMLKKLVDHNDRYAGDLLYFTLSLSVSDEFVDGVNERMLINDNVLIPMLKMLDCNKLLDLCIKPMRRLNCSKGVLVDTLSSATPLIQYLLNILLISTSTPPRSKYLLESLLLSQSIIFDIITIIYDRLYLHSIKIQLTSVFLGHNAAVQGNELTKKIVELAYSTSKKDFADDINVDITMRLYTAAISCYMIVFCKTQNQEKVFNSFIFQQLPWATKGLDNSRRFRDFKAGGDAFRTEIIGRNYVEIKESDQLHAAVDLNSKGYAKKSVKFSQYIKATALSTIRSGNSQYTSGPLFAERVSKEVVAEPMDDQPVFDTAVISNESNIYVPHFDDYTIALELSKVNCQPLMKAMIRLVVKVHNLFDRSCPSGVIDMPQWLSTVCSIMASTCHSINSHLFCLQLLINQPVAAMVAKYFSLFIDAFLDCCLRDLLADSSLSPDINNDIVPSYNYFLRDIVFTFVDSWAPSCSDGLTKNPIVVNKASLFINKLLEIMYDDEANISDSNVRSIIKLISVWNICPEKPVILNLTPVIALLQSEAGPTGGAHQKVSSKGSIGVRKRLTAMNFLTLLLVDAKYPLLELKYQSTYRCTDIIHALLNNVKYERREIYERASSLCGIILQIVSTGRGGMVYIDVCSSIASELEKILESRIKQPKGGLEVASKTLRCITTEYSLFLTRRLLNRFMSCFSNLKETGRYEFLDAIYNSAASIKAQYTDQDFMMLLTPFVTSLLNDLSRVVVRKKYHLPMVQILTLKILIEYSESLSVDFIDKLVFAANTTKADNAGPLMLVLSDICPREAREPAYALLLRLIQTNRCINDPGIRRGSKEDILKKRLIVLVLKGILDSDDEGMEAVMSNTGNSNRIGIRAKVLIFFNETYSLNKNPYSRLQLLMTDLYDASSTFVCQYWVQYAGYLLLLLSLDLASGNYLFTQNLADDSTFKQFRLNTKIIPGTLRSTQSQFQPLFSLQKHLHSQLSQKSALATQLSMTNKAFVGTQQVDWNWSPLSAPEVWTSGTQVMDTKDGATTEIMSNSAVATVPQSSLLCNSISQRVSKRLSRYNGAEQPKGTSESKFAKHSLDYYHSTTGSSKNITVYRKYRTGELPDIRITTEDVLKPLQALILRDKRLALLVYEEMFTELYMNLPNLTEPTAVSLRGNLMQTLNDSLCPDELTGLYMDCCVHFIKHEMSASTYLATGHLLTADALKPQQIVESSLKSSNVNLGISLLEECLVYHKNQPTERQERQDLVGNTWHSIFRLYNYLEEDELLQGVLPFLNHGELSRDALQYAHFSLYERALPLYARLSELEYSSSNTNQDSQDSDDEGVTTGNEATVYTGIWEDRFFETTKMLLSWDNIYCKVDELVQQHISGSAGSPLIDVMSRHVKLDTAQDALLVQRYVPYYIESLVHKVGVGLGRAEESIEKLELKEYLHRIFTGVTDHNRGNKDDNLKLLLSSAPNELLCAVLLCSDQLNSTELAKLRILIDKIYQSLMLRISSLHPYAIKARINNLLKLQQLVELEDITELLKNKDKAVDGSTANRLTKLWQISAPYCGVSPCAWEKLLIGRLIFIEETKDICDSSNFVCEYAAAASRAAISNSNLAAARIFLNQCSEHRREKAVIRLNEVVVAFEYNLKKINLAGEEPVDEEQLKILHETSNKMLLYIDKAKNQLNADESRILITVQASHQSTAIKLARDGIADTHLMTAIWKFSCLRRLQDCHLPDHTSLFRHQEIKDAYDNSIRDYSSDAKRGKAHVSLAYYCDQTIKSLKHDPMTDSLTSFKEVVDHDWIDEYASTAIIGYAKGLRLGSSFCRDRIPRLFDLLGQYNNGKGAEYYTDVISKIPAWAFLNCSSHLCGCLNISEQAPFIAAALEKLAVEYPNALIYQLSVSSCDASAGIKLRYCGPNTLDLLRNATMNMFMESLDYISHPELRWNDGLDAVETFLRNGMSERALVLYQDLVKRMRTGKHVGHQIGGYNVKVANKLEQIVIQEGGGLAECISLFADKDKAIAFIHKVRFHDVMAHASGKVSLLLFSEWLNSYNPSYRIEIPGQYLDDMSRPPDTSAHAFIQYINTELLVQPSIRRPKRMTFGGSDGLKYNFLIKGGEDLRIDERIQYIIRILNKLTSAKQATGLVDFEIATGMSHHGLQNADQKLCIKTYHIIPVTPRLGILEWLSHTKNLQCILENEMLLDFDFRRRNPDAFYNDNGIDKVSMHTLESSKLRESYIPSNEGNEGYHREIARMAMVECYQQMVRLLPPDFIKRKLYNSCEDAEVFFLMRNEYIRSLSVSSIITYVLGIGDRHLGNFLIELSTGKLISIDYGFNFGAGITQQGVPELVPFRLTPQIQGVISPLDCRSICRHYMVDYLYKLRQEENAVILRDMLSIFTNDPIDNWTDDTTQVRLENAMRKLKDENPTALLYEELARNRHVMRYKSLDRFTAIISAAAGTAKRKCSISEQVDVLLSLALDPECLGRSYIGFFGWM